MLDFDKDDAYQSNQVKNSDLAEWKIGVVSYLKWRHDVSA